MEILAKPNETLENHTRKVLKALGSLKDNYFFLQDLSGNSNFWKELYIAAVIHDFGKAAKGFQRMLYSIIEKKQLGKIPWWKYRHEFLSAGMAKSLNLQKYEQGVSIATLTHHKDISDLEKLNTINNQYNTEIFNEKALEIEEQEKKYLTQLGQKLLCESKQYIREEIIIPQDFVIKLEDPSEFIKRIKKDHILGLNLKNWRYYLFLKGVLTASDHLASAGYTEILNNSILKKYVNFPIFWDHQNQIKSVKTSCILNAPTGTGKTETAVLWANNFGEKEPGVRIFYILPYTASINAMYKRMSQKLGLIGYPYAVSMIHYRFQYFLHKILELDNNLVKINPKKVRELAKKVYSPVKIITPYQILKYLFSSKGFEQRLTEMTRSLMIFDEIHVYDVTLIGFLLEMIKFLSEKLEIKFLFMSATLPKHVKELFVEILPNIIELNASENLKKRLTRHRLIIYNNQIVESKEEIKNDLKQNKKVLIVCNTVKNAQIMYEMIKKYVKPEKRALIHGKFILRDREKQEKNAKDKKLLVGTQAIEVSLNISFDVLYTEIAPIDALVQRFGRINRKTVRPPENKLTIKPKPVKIFTIGGEYDSLIYSSEIINKTKDIILKYNNCIINEKKLETIVKEVYKEGYAQTEIKQLEKTRRIAKKLFNSIKPFKEHIFKFDELINGIQVIPKCYKEIYFEQEEENPLMAVKYYLTVTRQQFMRLKKNKKIEEKNQVLFVDAPYDEEIGLILQ